MKEPHIAAETTETAAEHGGSINGKLGRMLAYHEDRARAYRMVIGELNGTATSAKQNGHGGVLAAALALDGARRGKTPGKINNGAAVHAARTRTAALLEWLAKAPRTREEITKHGADLRAVSVLVRSGYLTERGERYVRTKKMFLISKGSQQRRATATKKPAGTHATTVRAQRTRTAHYLAQFDTETPKLFPSTALGAYVRRGYLKPRGDGYVRTAKEFSIEL